MQCKLPNVPCRSWETSQRTLNYFLSNPILGSKSLTNLPFVPDPSLVDGFAKVELMSPFPNIRHNNSKFADLFPKIDREHSGVYIALENRCSRRDERFFFKLRS